MISLICKNFDFYLRGECRNKDTLAMVQRTYSKTSEAKILMYVDKEGRQENTNKSNKK